MLKLVYSDLKNSNLAQTFNLKHKKAWPPNVFFKLATLSLKISTELLKCSVHCHPLKSNGSYGSDIRCLMGINKDENLFLPFLFGKSGEWQMPDKARRVGRRAMDLGNTLENISFYPFPIRTATLRPSYTFASLPSQQIDHCRMWKWSTLTDDSELCS